MGSLKELSQTSVKARLAKTEEQKRLDQLAERRRQWEQAQQASARRAEVERLCRVRGWSSLACQRAHAQDAGATGGATYYYPGRGR